MLNKIYSLIARFRHNAFWKSVVILAGGTGLGQLILVVATPILTRIYDPADFGVLTVFVSSLGLLVVIASLRYQIAIPLPEEEDVAANLVVLGMSIVIGFSVIIGLVVFFAGRRIAELLSAPQLAPYLWLFPFAVLAGGLYQVFIYWHIRKKRFKRLTQARVGQSAVLVTTQISLGLLGAGPLGLVGGYVTGQTTAGIMLALGMLRERSVFSRVSWEGLKSSGRRYMRFPLISSWSALLNNGGLQLPPLLFATFFGVSVAGLYGLAQRIVAIPVTLIGRSVAQVYLSEASHLYNRNPLALRQLFLRTATKLFVYVGLPIVLVGLMAPWGFGFLFGEQWKTSGFYIIVLLPMFLGQIVVMPLSQSLNILERQDLQLMWDAGRLLAVTLSIGAAHYIFHLQTLATIAFYGAVMFVMYVVLFLAIWKQLSLLPARHSEPHPD